ncbi:MAG: hypothetical protein M5U26_05200 [Planctomycetota bacterium]|nr:hypothetical protein [Planctomycetota bacterium]
MEPPEPTGNPVFDYRAGFRRSAAGVQKLLLSGGLLALLAGAGCALPAASRAFSIWIALGGLVLLAAGVAWGFLWRRALREGFRKTYRGFDE